MMSLVQLAASGVFTLQLTLTIMFFFKLFLNVCVSVFCVDFQTNFLIIIFYFFVKKSFRFCIKWRCRWNIWYDGRQLENHDPTFVISCCPWFAVDLWISLIWSVLSLSKLVRAILSKLDWQCRYDVFRIWGRLKTSCLRIKTENKFRTGKIFTANCYFEFAGLRFKNGGWIC